MTLGKRDDLLYIEAAARPPARPTTRNLSAPTTRPHSPAPCRQPRRYRGIALTATPAYAADVLVDDYASLELAIANADNDTVIIFENTIIAEGNLPPIDDDITVDGAGYSYDGVATYNGFVVDGSTVGFTDLTVTQVASYAVSANAGSSITLGAVTTDSGISTLDADVTILDSHFTDVRSTVVGDTIDVHIERTTFTGITSGDGIQLYVDFGDLTLIDVTASLNNGRGLDVRLSGGATFYASGLLLTENVLSGISALIGVPVNATITGSTAQDNGIHGFELDVLEGAQLLITDTTSTENQNDGFPLGVHGVSQVDVVRVLASENGEDGIEVATSDHAGRVYISDSTVDSNGYGLHATYAPGHPEGLDLMVSTSTISNSTNDGVHGTIGFESRLLVQNSTLSGNGSLLGDSAFDLDGEGELVVRHTTITETGAPAADSAINLDGGPSVNLEVTLDHVINAGNLVGEDLAITASVNLTVLYSLIGTANANASPAVTGGTGNLFGITDPQLGPLADNGGPTLTHLPAESSAAVDAGNPSIVGAPATDQRGAGHARVINGTIDIGSVERTALLSATGVEAAPLVLSGFALLIVGGLLILRRARTTA